MDLARLKQRFERNKSATDAAAPAKPLACPAIDHINQPGDDMGTQHYRAPAVCTARGPRHLVCRPCIIRAATAALEASEQTGQG